MLFIDVDLQGSLTSLLMPFEKINALNADERLLQHFLTTTASSGPVNMLQYAQEVFPGSGGSIIPTSDRSPTPTRT